MTQLKTLHDEFTALKNKLFGNNMFVVLDQKDQDTIRYNQLLQFFFPCYRTKDFNINNVINGGN